MVSKLGEMLGLGKNRYGRDSMQQRVWDVIHGHDLVTVKKRSKRKSKMKIAKESRRRNR